LLLCIRLCLRVSLSAPGVVVSLRLTGYGGETDLSQVFMLELACYGAPPRPLQLAAGDRASYPLQAAETRIQG
ncbi:hypothetical protein FocTR4_00012172, partial [Fusarium oxysporum f. sp. cubense]